MGTIAGAGVGSLFGGVGAGPGALIGNRVGWILVGGAMTANAALLLLRDGDSAEQEGAGARSAEEYDRHVRGVEEARGRLEELQGQLDAATGPRARRPIQQQIDRLRKDIRGHEKEIRQKWPDGRPND